MSKHIYSGSLSNEVTERERKHRIIACRAAAEGIVLMKNEGILPIINVKEKIALFGIGASRTVKGGSGSGDVNERESVSIYHGLLNMGYNITSRDWIEEYEERYHSTRAQWRDTLLAAAEGRPGDELFGIYASHPYIYPQGREISVADIGGADTAIYVISRLAGEGVDRKREKGDYFLSEKEEQDLEMLSANCGNIVVIINAGAQIDVSSLVTNKKVKAIVNVSQPGMEGGNALAQVLAGRVSPSGKLTDTWAKRYEDFPNADIFSYNDGDVTKERYEEGIYVGYRYFDTFQVEPEFPFGFGLSYTDFALTEYKVEATSHTVTVSVQVKNKGNRYSGKEVVQVYATCPQTELEKEYRRLCGYEKTKELAAGESQWIQVEFPMRALASFSKEKRGWIMEAGEYGIWVGNSSQNNSLAAVLKLEADVILEIVKKVCPLQEVLIERKGSKEILEERQRAWQEQAREEKLPVILIQPEEKKKTPRPYETEEKAKEITAELTRDELVSMVVGQVGTGLDFAIGIAGIAVPGSAGETSSVLRNRGIRGISMADGPAGLRLLQKYEADRESGEIYTQGYLESLEGGFLRKDITHENADMYYQFCTAFPAGIMMAQTWNKELQEEVGCAVGVEMNEFHVSWWLAPGMNIHRNPLCGRNFEYYSEDPVVSGLTAAAIIRGVQKNPGAGTTLKHFACNNAEDNRVGSDSIVSERALREIYLKGFEIAVKEEQPMAIMTSYNLLNGIHTANNRDLCTVIAREEWNFQGIIMTDWTTTLPGGGSIAWMCPAAGNDLIMPGCESDKENIKAALEEGKLIEEELKKCVERLLKVILSC